MYKRIINTRLHIVFNRLISPNQTYRIHIPPNILIQRYSTTSFASNSYFYKSQYRDEDAKWDATNTTTDAQIIIHDTKELLSQFVKNGGASQHLVNSLDELCKRILSCRLKRILLPCVVKLIAVYLKWIQPDPLYRSVSLEGALLSAYLYNVSQLINRQVLFYLAWGNSMPNENVAEDSKIQLEPHVSKLLSLINPKEFPSSLLSQMFYMITRSERAKILMDELDSLCKKGYQVPADAFVSILFQLSIHKSSKYFDFLNSMIQAGHDRPTCYAMTVRHCLDNLNSTDPLERARYYEELGFKRNILQQPSSFKACEKILLHYLSHKYFDDASRMLIRMKTNIPSEILKQHHVHVEKYCLIWSSQFGQDSSSTLRFLYNLFRLNSSIDNGESQIKLQDHPHQQVKQIGLPVHPINIPFLVYVYCRFGMMFLSAFIRSYETEFKKMIMDRPCVLLDAALIIRNHSQIVFARFVKEELFSSDNIKERDVIFTTGIHDSKLPSSMESDGLIQELILVWKRCMVDSSSSTIITLEPFTISLMFARWTRMHNISAMFDLFDYFVGTRQWQYLLKRSTFMTLMNRFISHRDWNRVSKLLSASIKFKLTTNRVDDSLSMLFHQANYITSQLSNDSDQAGVTIFSDLVPISAFLDRFAGLSYMSREINENKDILLNEFKNQNIYTIGELRRILQGESKYVTWSKISIPNHLKQHIEDAIIIPKSLEELRTNFLRHQQFYKETESLLDD